MKPLDTVFRFFLLALFSMVSPYSAAGGEQGIIFSISQSISNNKVNAFAQDKDGFIWMGTMNGLNRYNGYSFRNYYASRDANTLVSDNICDICFDSDGNLWVATNYGFAVLKDGSFLNTEQPYYDPVYRIVQLNESNMALLCREGLLKISRENLECTASYVSTGLNPSLAIDVSQIGQVWFVDKSESSPVLKVLDPDFASLDSIPLPVSDKPFTVSCNSDNSIWVSDGNVISIFNGRTHAKETLPSSLEAVLRRGAVLFMRHYGENQILLGIEGGGLFVYDLYKKSVSRILFGVSPEKDNSVCFVDSDKNIWLSDRSNGFRRLSPRDNAERIDVSKIVSGDNIGSAFFDDEGYLWFCTDEEYASLEVGTGRVLWRKKSSSMLNHLALDKEGRLWMTENDKTLVRYDLSRGKASETARFDMPWSVMSICPNPDGGIFAALTLETYLIDGGGEVKRIPVDTRQENTYFTDTFGDPAGGGVYLVGMIDSTFVYDGSRFVSMELKGINGVSSVLETPDARWIGTINGGLFFLDKDSGKVNRFGKGAGLGEDSIRSILQDGQGNIWISTPNNIYKYDNDSGVFVRLVESFGVRENYYEIGVASVSPNNLLVFGGGKEIVFINPLMEISAGTSLPLYFDSISINDEQIVDIPETITLPYDKKVLTLNYSVLDFTSGPTVNYSYRLDGLESSWNDAGHTGRTTYTNLRPGKYLFRVRARLLNSDWNGSELTIPIRVKHSFFNSIPTKISLLVLLLAVAAVILRQVNLNLEQKEHLRLSKERENQNQRRMDLMMRISSQIKNAVHSLQETLEGVRRQSGLPAEDLSRNIGIIEKLAGDLSEGNVPPQTDSDDEIISEDDSSDSGSDPDDHTVSKEMSKRDLVFLQKLDSLMESHLSDGNFNIDDMAREMNMSRSSLFKKVKALTGDSPVSYIKAYRMNEAMDRLRSGDYTVGEVAIDIGASNVSNFSRDFKNYFGITPSSVLDGNAPEN